MSRFKFKKLRKKFRWESDFMALEFSNPSIQGFSEFTNLASEKEIMYYYYDVKIFKKLIEWDEEDNEIVKSKLVSERSTHDFDNIKQLKGLLEYQLTDNTIKDGQKIEYQNGVVRYSKVVSTGGFACDDFYEITKNVNVKGKEDRYVVYCGTTFDAQGDLNSVGIRTPYVGKADIEELLKCVNEFIKYSLEEHNKEMSIWKEAYEVRNGKIYEYGLNRNNKLIDKNVIESIYIVGDKLGITMVIDNKQSKCDGIVKKIEGDTIFLENGTLIKDKDIRYISNEPTKEMLTYKENEIAKDFLDILSSEEKEEFKICDVELLLNKYKMAIIDRTWMCRDEHGFDRDYGTGNNVNAVTPIVKTVINKIKSNLVNNY